MTPLTGLRQTLRQARRAVPDRLQRERARLLLRVLRRDLPYQRARRIAAYWPADGELDPRPLIRQAHRRGKAVYLPVLRRGLGGRAAKLRFVRFLPGTGMRANRFGIPEPTSKGRHIRPARHLDVLLVPLVGFDSTGNRIGMGGGYYDRTLSFLNERRQWRRPRLIGIAHECQRVATIEPRAWDVPLQTVATERRLYARSRRPAVVA
jgi:5-formyltetrahydrofolate cyclo-ligase